MPRQLYCSPAAASENSIRPVARYAPLVPLVAGALLLILAEFLTVREIRAVTVVPPGGTETGGALHGYALGIIGLAILVMTYGAVVRGARPAAIALLVLARGRVRDRAVRRPAGARRHGADRPHLRPRRGAAGDRLLPREPGRGAGAGRRGGDARCSIAAGNPARARPRTT